jgi:RNA dependent RNA polymerase
MRASLLTEYLCEDFPKSGKPAKLEDELRVRVFPDFMEKKDKESYESQKVLGKIYRLIDKKDYRKYKDVLTSEATYDQRLYVEGMHRYIAEARELKLNYDRDILSLMNQFGVLSEAEIVSGYIIKWLRKDNKRRSHEVHKQTMHAVTSLRKVYRSEFYREFLDESKKEIARDRLPDVEAKAAAWHYVTYHPDEAARIVQKSPDRQRFFSFCWIVDTHLCNIAKNNSQQMTNLVNTMDLDSIEAYRKPLNEETVDLITRTKIQNLKLSQAILSDEEDNDELDDESDFGPVLSIKLKELVDQPVSQGQTSSFDSIIGYPMEDEKRTVARADDGMEGLKKALGFM